ncbi:hypothetical protein NLX67_15085 [Domibacillus sp. A3M-37]|uniref:hypothetical protein n=1 Tax=Domibacillus sp. A3M-37 TaxID=2962037 RepID=UPI0020B6AC2C|nr:hypothetical protein [Domibacillus sp. A3M-37]MCP3763699.1 hypothetical protein [Domibacillus sp. A3M-37]
MGKTPTSEAKEIILSLLKSEPGKEFTIPEIKKEISLKSTQEITDGTISGSLHSLIKNRKNSVFNVSRGTYSYNPNEIEGEPTLVSKLYGGVVESINKLEDVAKSVDVLLLDEKDIPILQKMKKLINDLESFNNELAKTYSDEINRQK